MSDLIIRSTTSADAKLITQLMTEYWGGEPLIIRGNKYFPSQLQGFIVERAQNIIGFLIYEIKNNACEVVVFEIFEKLKGIGTQVLEKLKALALEQNCERLFLITTNDNIDALRFYQKRGFCICGIRIDSIKNSRKLKSTIALIGDYGIPLRDEIELELFL